MEINRIYEKKIDDLERKLGLFPKITKKTKVISSTLSGIIKNMNNINSKNTEENEQIEFFLQYWILILKMKEKQLLI